MAAQPMFKLVMLLVVINTILYMGGVRLVGDDNVDMMNSFIDVNKSVNGSVVVSGELIDVLPKSFERSGSDVLNFIDAIAAIGTFIVFIINIVFTPLGLFMSVGVPASLNLIIGIPLMTGLLLGIAYFIRGSG